MNWKAAFLLGAFFAICAFLYWVLPYIFQPGLVDYTGFVLLASSRSP